MQHLFTTVAWNKCVDRRKHIPRIISQTVGILLITASFRPDIHLSICAFWAIIILSWLQLLREMSFLVLIPVVVTPIVVNTKYLHQLLFTTFGGPSRFEWIKSMLPLRKQQLQLLLFLSEVQHDQYYFKKWILKNN